MVEKQDQLAIPVADPNTKTPRPGDGTHVGAMLAKIEPELSDRQIQIVKMKMRGLTQTAIAQVLGISQPAVAKHLKIIRAKFAAMGSNIDQSVVVGESVNLFQEVEQRAWELYYSAKGAGKLSDANKALNVIMSARDKTLTLLMDLGLIRRAAIEHEHKVKSSPLMEQWKSGEAQKKFVVRSIIETQLEELEEPTPPPEDIEDAEWMEIDDGETHDE